MTTKTAPALDQAYLAATAALEAALSTAMIDLSVIAQCSTDAAAARRAQAAHDLASQRIAEVRANIAAAHAAHRAFWTERAERLGI